LNGSGPILNRPVPASDPALNRPPRVDFLNRPPERLRRCGASGRAGVSISDPRPAFTPYPHIRQRSAARIRRFGAVGRAVPPPAHFPRGDIRLAPAFPFDM